MRHAATILARTLVLCTCAVPALAQPVPPDYGLDWRTIGDPGNVAAQPADYFWLQFRGYGPVGRVDYEYRLTTTEITNSQWIEFVDAYAHANPSVNINDWAFTGRDVYRASDDPANYGWYAAPGAENAAAVMGWLYAARYCNWLESGKASNLAAFESGVYDMSTFLVGPNGEWVGESQHAPGARYWLPDWDEWTKGMHWDPNKSGPGQGGYWLYPHSSDELPIGGWPGTPGAQTSAGTRGPPWFVPVGSYPTAVSPWGLLDGSGGAAEYLGFWESGAPDTRGSYTGDLIGINERLDYLGTAGFPDYWGGGFRLASAIPTPGSLPVVMLVAAAQIQRRRR